MVITVLQQLSLKHAKPPVKYGWFSLSKKSFEILNLKVFWSSNFSKMLAESKGRAFGRRPQTAKYLIGGAFTRGELTKQPSGLFFKRGRFARKSVPLLCPYLNLSADLIGTIIKNEVFLQSETFCSNMQNVFLIYV